MDPRWAKACVLAGAIVMIAIRAPHGQRSLAVKVARSRKGTLETVLLTLAWLGFFVPIAWIASPVFDCADFPLRPAPFAAGAACIAAGLWMFHRSHADLGTNWSITLEVREGHRLVTSGIYGLVRHPMYLALLLYAAGQALVAPNWIAGPAYAVPLVLIVACRLGPEERMMREEFGAEYEAYARRTRRLIPGIW